MKKKTDSKTASDAFRNRAIAIKGAIPIDCERCGKETPVFIMRDNYHTFSVGMFTILQCLKEAESQGCVPDLPDDWWAAALKSS